MRSRGSTLRPALIGLAMLAAAGAGLAQEGPNLPVPRAAVLPFMPPMDGPDRMIGRRAGHAVWAALQDESPWELVDPGWLLRLAETSQARPPFAVGHLQMFGHRARAPLALTGSVRTLKVDPKRGTVQVTTVVELTETLEGTVLTTVRGVASARREEGEVLGQAVDGALSEAGGDAARKLGSFDPLTAVVVASLPDGRVMMDGPEEPRIKSGAKMLVYRGRRTGPEPVGALEVTTSRVTVLHARPQAGEDFRQGDRAVIVAR